MVEASDAAVGGLRGWLRRHRNEFSLLVAVAVVVVITTFVSDAYRANPGGSAEHLLRHTAKLGIIALGAATVIIAGGIDLSSGSVIAFSATACTSIILLLAPQEANGPVTDDLPFWILATAFTGTMFCAFLIGSFHAWLITAVGLPPFVATLASLVGLRSLARLLIEEVTKVAYDKTTGNSQIYIYDEFYHDLGNVWWSPVLIFMVISLALGVLLSKTVVGRHLYAMGGNEDAARLSGIRTVRLKWLAYCVGSMTAAVAGILHSGEIQMAEPVNDGLGFELSAIAAAVVGGCSLTGGVGTVTGVMLGALFLRVVIDSVAKSFTQKADILEGLIVGILVVLAVAFNEVRVSGGIRKQFFEGFLGLLNVLILAVLGGIIAFLTTPENKLRNGLAVACGTLLLLGARAFAERRAAAKALTA